MLNATQVERETRSCGQCYNLHIGIVLHGSRGIGDRGCERGCDWVGIHLVEQRWAGALLSWSPAVLRRFGQTVWGQWIDLACHQRVDG